ncbi:MAG TPA: hypothetical protein VFB02_01140 [Bradyrhizobium sp.]|nr:hypothetical protein [Bradyrhizobium sp.]
MAEKSIDPMAFWQKIMGEMEKGLNSYANQAMERVVVDTTVQPKAVAHPTDASSRMG